MGSLLRSMDAIDASATSVSSTVSGQPRASPPNTKDLNGKLFVGGLAWETTEDSLRPYFRHYGPLELVIVKEGRGFGLVFFCHPKDAGTVLKNTGHHIVDQKSVDVKPYVTPREGDAKDWNWRDRNRYRR